MAWYLIVKRRDKVTFALFFGARIFMFIGYRPTLEYCVRLKSAQPTETCKQTAGIPTPTFSDSGEVKTFKEVNISRSIFFTVVLLPPIHVY
jgi:hypothetical protein